MKMYDVLSSLILLVVLFNIHFVNAENVTNFEISIHPRYFNQGYEFNRYSEDMDYEGISFEIVGTNSLQASRIINLTLFEATPEIFKNSLTQKLNILNITQTKTIFQTGIIEKKDINNSQFFIAILGFGENDNEPYYAEKYINLSLIQNNTESQVISKIGNAIWEGEPIKGLYIGLIIICIMIFIMWKYKLVGHLNKSMEDYRKRERYKRLNPKKYEYNY